MKIDEEVNKMACKYASNFPSQYEERKNAFIAGCNAMLQVKLLATPAVSKCVSLEGRELLLDFLEDVIQIQHEESKIVDKEAFIDSYLKSSNSC